MHLLVCSHKINQRRLELDGTAERHVNVSAGAEDEEDQGEEAGGEVV